MCYSAATPPKKQRADLCGEHKAALDPQPSNERMTIMTTNTSARTLEDTPHEIETTIITISDATKRRAESVINDKTIDPQGRTTIRGALKLDDPCLAELVNRAEAGENIEDTFESLKTSDTDEDDSDAEKIEALAEIICRAGDEPMAALFVVMRTLEDSADPYELANAAKSVAFSRCSEVACEEWLTLRLKCLNESLFAQ